MSDQSQLATRPEKAPVLAGDRGLKFSSLDDMWRFAVCAVNSGIYKDIPTPEVAIIKIQAGLELGLTPVWALCNILVIQGRCTVWGDALLGLVLAAPECEDVIETTTGEFPSDSFTAICEVRRKGRVPVIRDFSVADAKKAGLFGKTGPWQQYPKRMVAMRARAFACRDAFSDRLRGLGVTEEVRDIDNTPKQVQARVVKTELQLPPEEEPESAQKPETTATAENPTGELF